MRRTIILMVVCAIALANIVCTACGVYPGSVSWIISGLVLIIDAYFLGEMRGEDKVPEEYIEFLEKEFERSKKIDKEYEELAKEILNEEKNNKK